MDLKQFIIAKSKEFNIDIIGFTDCKPLDNLKEYLFSRKEEKREIEFEEKDIGKRINPKITFPNCKTIIVIGMSYNNDFNEIPDYKLKGRLSKSTWGMDYHQVLKSRMEKLVQEIKREIDFSYAYYVDTGPLIDRELAKKAGMGYYGKNSSIINDKYGSFIFIGYLLTDLDIKINPLKVIEKCGDCQICIKSCPTGALEAPYKFNPKKCISYLTQTRKKIPYELRDKIGNKIYGCDTCQLVCPKNKTIKKSNHTEFIPEITKGYMNIEELLTISNKEFKNKYGHMAGSWRGKNILKRNAIIVLGNTKDRENLRFLVPLLKDSNPMIREYAAWAILNIDFEYGKGVIREVKELEKDTNVKLEMENLIEYFNGKNTQQ